MKNIKKIFSMLLVILCLLSCFNASTVFALDSTVTDHQAVVLVLDTSGSMEGDPITNLKKAALEFCRKIIAADKNNQIAIVTFADSNEINDFSNNLTELSSTISSISAYGGTSMADAIKSADNLLQENKVKNGYAKSIVIMADGEPWDDTQTVTTATSLFSNYNMYSIGFFDYENESAKNLLKSIQNCGYYEANNVDDLINEFLKIATDILNPFTITLSHNQESVIADNNPTGNFIFTYTIKVVINNGNVKEATNVKAIINLDNGMNLSNNNQKEINIGTLSAKETKELVWTVEIPIPIFSETTTKQYSVTASSDNTVDISAYDKIIIEDTASDKNNELDFSKDIWNFENYTVDKIPLTTEDYNALMYGRSNTEKQKLDDIINQKHGGQCYGMAATTVLSKMKIIGISDLQENANSLYDVKKNEKAKSLIGYYHIFSRLTFTNSETGEDIFLWNLENKTEKEKLSTIASLAQSVKNGGNPFVLRFELPNDNGHAVVAYAYEVGNFRKNGRNYSHRILIYDSNYPPKWNKKWDEDSCLYFNEGDSSWCIPNYTKGNLKAISLTGAVSDLNILNYYDIETNRKNYYAELKSKNQTKFLINSVKHNYKIDGVRTTDLNVHSGTDLESGCSELTVLLPNKNDSYTVINPNGKDLLDLSMNYENYYMVANSSNCERAEFNPDGSVGIKDNTSDFKISLTGNDGYAPLRWYTISAMGNNTSNPSLSIDGNGYILDGDNLTNITITGRNDEETKELTFTTTEDKVLIGENKNELTVSIDKDKDGTYETVIANSGNKKNQKETAELKNLETENFKLTPAFASTVRDYTSTVDYSVSKVSLIPTLENGTTATISVNSSKAIAFDNKQTVDLKIGENKIEIVVSGNNLVSSKYTIIVKRSPENNNKINYYNDSNPNTGGYISEIPIIVLLVLILSIFILVNYLRLKAKRQKDL